MKPGIKINPKQALFLQSEKPKQGIMFGGRSSGKTVALIMRLYLMWRRFPRAKGFLAGNTFGQMMNIVLKDFREIFASFGIHKFTPTNPTGLYVIFKTPPPHFSKPYKGVEDYKYCITFINGFSVQLLSFDNGGLNRGGDYDFGDVDEIALFSDSDYQRVLSPMMRANPDVFDDPLHHTFRGYTSMPRDVDGEWIYRIEDIAMNSKQRLATWVECSCIDNYMNLPKNYIADMKLSMTPEEFDIEVMNKRPDKISNTYYPAFSTKKHTTTPYDYSYDDEIGLHYSKLSSHNLDAEIKATFDFNANFMSVATSQITGKHLYFFDELFLKKTTHQTLVHGLAHALCEKLKYHRHKVIVVSGDPGGKKKYENSSQSSYEIIEDVFKSFGWKVKMRPLNSYTNHQKRHRKINEALAETKFGGIIIQINAENCPCLIRSIRNAPMLPNWTKDKRSEKSAIPQEFATHFSDIFDYCLMEYIDSDLILENDVEVW